MNRESVVFLLNVLQVVIVVLFTISLMSAAKNTEAMQPWLPFGHVVIMYSGYIICSFLMHLMNLTMQRL